MIQSLVFEPYEYASWQERVGNGNGCANKRVLRAGLGSDARKPPPPPHLNFCIQRLNRNVMASIKRREAYVGLTLVLPHGVFPSCRMCVCIRLLPAPPPAPQVKVLQELFPSLNPVRLVEGAPMLLALSESTLRAKSEAWRNVLEARVEQPWEQVSVHISVFVKCYTSAVYLRSNAPTCGNGQYVQFISPLFLCFS